MCKCNICRSMVRGGLGSILNFDSWNTLLLVPTNSSSCVWQPERTELRVTLKRVSISDTHRVVTWLEICRRVQGRYHKTELWVLLMEKKCTERVLNHINYADSQMIVTIANLKPLIFMFVYLDNKWFYQTPRGDQGLKEFLYARRLPWGFKRQWPWKPFIFSQRDASKDGWSGYPL